jgi:flavin reductase (DIM6/NTAB) family NADH-FMN oxidoreductase RutF
LIFALPAISENDPVYSVNIQVAFTQQSYLTNGFLKEKDAIAWLSLKLIQKQATGSHYIFYYQGETGHHRFLSSFHQFILSLNNRLYNNIPGNVFLHDNLYKQVQVAYSVPRIISLITTGNNELYNLFPTDLHGSINDEYYIISLRESGKACQQVEKTKRIIISQMNCSRYKDVYSLGKNHMQEFQTKDKLPFSHEISSGFKLPVPSGTLGYNELELVESFAHNIHKILLFKIISKQKLEESAETLAHIHNAYATWRFNNGLPGNYLLR